MSSTLANEVSTVDAVCVGFSETKIIICQWTASTCALTSCLLNVCRCKGSDVCEARTVCLTLNDSFVVNRNAIVIVFFDRMALRFPCRCARFDICRWRTDTSRRVVHIRNVPRLSQSLYNDVLQPWQSINSQLASQIYSCLMLCELFVVPIKLCALENRSLFLSSFSANLCIVCNYWFHFSDDADFRKWN